MLTTTEQSQIVDSAKKALEPFKSEIVGHEKMHQELSMLQDKIKALENKLKQTSCVGFDTRSMSVVSKKEDKSPLNRSHENAYQSADTSRISRTPIIPSKRSGLSCEKAAKAHTHSNSNAKPPLEISHRNYSLAGIPSAPAKSSPKQIKTFSRTKLDYGLKSAKKDENKENMRTHNDSVQQMSSAKKRVARNESRTKIADESPKEELLKLLLQKKEKEVDKWKKKYETLKETDDKLQQEHKQLAENYKASETIRKQQRKRIHELEKKTKKVHKQVEIQAEMQRPKTSSCISVNVKKKLHK